MQYPEQPGFGTAFPGEPPAAKSSTLWWVIGGIAIVSLLVCSGSFAFLVAKAPNTAVYKGSEIPDSFLNIARDVGALESGESILYFYSDAMWNIRHGFYFVSDRKVAVYSKDFADVPLISVGFNEIVDVQIERNLSFFEDSLITLYLDGGDTVFFPVSSEWDRDREFFEEIRQRTGPVFERRR